MLLYNYQEMYISEYIFEFLIYITLTIINLITINTLTSILFLIVLFTFMLIHSIVLMSERPTSSKKTDFKLFNAHVPGVNMKGPTRKGTVPTNLTGGEINFIGKNVSNIPLHFHGEVYLWDGTAHKNTSGKQLEVPSNVPTGKLGDIDRTPWYKTDKDTVFVLGNYRAHWGIDNNLSYEYKPNNTNHYTGRRVATLLEYLYRVEGQKTLTLRSLSYESVSASNFLESAFIGYSSDTYGNKNKLIYNTEEFRESLRNLY